MLAEDVLSSASYETIVPERGQEEQGRPLAMHVSGITVTCQVFRRFGYFKLGGTNEEFHLSSIFM